MTQPSTLDKRDAVIIKAFQEKTDATAEEAGDIFGKIKSVKGYSFIQEGDTWRIEIDNPGATGPARLIRGSKTLLEKTPGKPMVCDANLGSQTSVCGFLEKQIVPDYVVK